MAKDYKEGIRASFITLTINVLLTVVKFIAGFIGNSKAMIADAIHTLSDVLTTVVVMVGLNISSKEADKGHPYGHERFELVFSKILALFLLLVGGYIGYQGIISLQVGEFETPGQIALIAAVLSIIFKEVMYQYTIRVAKKIGSVSMEADAWHHRSDALSSIGTFVGILGARLGLPILDPIASIVVAFMIIKVGIDLYIESVRGLVDEAADSETVKEIKDLALSVEGVKGIDDLKTRTFANKIYVDIEILVDGCQTVHKGHDIAKEVHDLIEGEMEEVKHCMCHVEPYNNKGDC